MKMCRQKQTSRHNCISEDMPQHTSFPVRSGITSTCALQYHHAELTAVPCSPSLHGSFHANVHFIRASPYTAPEALWRAFVCSIYFLSLARVTEKARRQIECRLLVSTRRVLLSSPRPTCRPLEPAFQTSVRDLRCSNHRRVASSLRLFRDVARDAPLDVKTT